MHSQTLISVVVVVVYLYFYDDVAIAQFFVYFFKLLTLFLRNDSFYFIDMWF